MERIGIYGGTFDPVHRAHLMIIRRMCEVFDKVIIVPTSMRHYKNKTSIGMFTFEARCEMLRTACAIVLGDETMNEKVIISEAEKDVDYDTWSTVSLIKMFKKEYPADEICFVIGSDSFNNLPKWRNGNELPDLCEIYVVGRQGEDVKEQGISYRNLLIEYETDMSSSKFREEIINFIANKEWNI